MRLPSSNVFLRFVPRIVHFWKIVWKPPTKLTFALEFGVVDLDALSLVDAVVRLGSLGRFGRDHYAVAIQERLSEMCTRNRPLLDNNPKNPYEIDFRPRGDLDALSLVDAVVRLCAF